MKTNKMVVLSLIVLGMSLASTAHGIPTRSVLSDAALDAIRGGAAASIGINYPQDFASSTAGSSGTSWNRNGNVCQYSCTSGSAGRSTEVGYDVGVVVVQVTGTGQPTLNIYSDGKKRASTLAAFNSTQGSFDVWIAAMKTKCSGGSRDGQFCTNDGTCRQSCQGFCSVTTGQTCGRLGDPACPTGETCVETGTNCTPLLSQGNCLTFDQSGGHNTAGTADGPCNVATAYDSNGETTCYLLQECSKNPISFPNGGNSNCPTSGGEVRVNCATNGAPESVNNFKNGTLNSGGPVHTALIEAVTSAGPISSETVYKIVDANQSTSPTNCVGTNED
jgi:hypothetical protein